MNDRAEASRRADFSLADVVAANACFVLFASSFVSDQRLNLSYWVTYDVYPWLLFPMYLLWFMWRQTTPRYRGVTWTDILAVTNLCLTVLRLRFQSWHTHMDLGESLFLGAPMVLNAIIMFLFLRIAIRAATVRTSR
jgi:hypothetical protein